MRISTIGRLLALVLLLGSILTVPALSPPISIVAADEGKDESGKNQDKEKDDEKKDKEDKKNKDKGNKGGNGNGNGNGAAITASEGYEVGVSCAYDDSAGMTTCTFTGVAPDGAKDVSHIDMPEDAICAEVLGGDHEYVDPDPNTHVTGYKSRGSEGTFTLELEGEVAVEGTTTYWFKTGDGVFPATGPGITCGGDSAGTFVLQVTPGSAQTATEATATPAATTGELVVLIYTCADVPEDTTGFDWFQSCNSEGGIHGLALAPVSEVPVEPVTMQTDESGDATFAGLEPGLYSLEMTGTTWCKAVSDNVDAEGNVIIAAGARTTVYGFVCEGKPVA